MPLRHRCEYAAVLPRSLPDSSCPPPREFPTGFRQVRAASSPDPPGFELAPHQGGVTRRSSRTPLRPASGARTIWQYWPVPALSGPALKGDRAVPDGCSPRTWVRRSPVVDGHLGRYARTVASLHHRLRPVGHTGGVLTDNGAIFTGQPRRGGRTALEITLGALGIKYRRSDLRCRCTCISVGIYRLPTTPSRDTFHFVDGLHE